MVLDPPDVTADTAGLSPPEVTYIGEVRTAPISSGCVSTNGLTLSSSPEDNVEYRQVPALRRNGNS